MARRITTVTRTERGSIIFQDLSATESKKWPKRKVEQFVAGWREKLWPGETLVAVKLQNSGWVVMDLYLVEEQVWLSGQEARARYMEYIHTTWKD